MDDLQRFVAWFQEFPFASVSGLFWVIIIEAAVVAAVVVFIRGEDTRLEKKTFGWYVILLLGVMAASRWEQHAALVDSWWSPVAYITFTVLSIVVVVFGLVCLWVAFMKAK